LSASRRAAAPSGPPAGTYIDPLHGTVQITRTDQGLRIRYGRVDGPLEHWHYDTFRARSDDEWRGTARVTFRLGADGSVASLEARGGEFRRQE
jgi:hypothetical protein